MLKITDLCALFLHYLVMEEINYRSVQEAMPVYKSVFSTVEIFKNMSNTYRYMFTIILSLTFL